MTLACTTVKEKQHGPRGARQAAATSRRRAQRQYTTTGTRARNGLRVHSSGDDVCRREKPAGVSAARDKHANAIRFPERGRRAGSMPWLLGALDEPELARDRLDDESLRLRTPSAPSSQGRLGVPLGESVLAVCPGGAAGS